MKSPISNFCVFDLETTGLSADKHAIVEIACCPLSFDLKELPEFDSGIMRIYDNREITDGALNANGITRDQIANGKDPKEVFENLCKFLLKLKDGKNKPVLAGHNIDKFDIPCLVNFFEFHGKDLSNFVNTDLTIDTMWFARLKAQEQFNFKLGTCCEVEGIELTNAHRAIHDTRANKDLVKIYIQNLRSKAGVVEGIEKKQRIRFQL